MLLGYIKQLAGSFGVDIRRRRDDIQVALRRNRCQTILDIGANTGQFAERARRVLPQAEIYSFEPVPEALTILRKRAQRDERLHVVPLALGASEQVCEMQVIDGFTPGSSFLKMTEQTSRALRDHSRQRAYEVRVSTLDAWALPLALEKPLGVKLDVQGYENQVIAGGEQTIGEASVVIVEVSYKPVYRGQGLFDDTYVLMRDKGFQCVGITDLTYLPGTEELIQADAIFEPQRPNA